MPATTNQATDQTAFNLAARGDSTESIAQRLGMPNRQAAYHAVRRHAQRIGTPMPTQRRVRNPRTGTTSTVLVGFDRKFGVEIELKGLSCDAAARALVQAGVQAEAQGYNHRTLSYWKVVPDGSVSGGCEVVSPPLSGEQGRNELRTVMAALIAAGARVDRECGMHVHHDMDGLDGETIAKFVETWAARQSEIDLLVSPSRRNGANVYSRPLNVHEIEQIAASFRSTRRAPQFTDRYRNLNVASFPKYGTIEIRQHQGTLNGAKAIAWVMFVQSIIAAVASDATIGEGADMIPSLSLPTEQATSLRSPLHERRSVSTTSNRGARESSVRLVDPIATLIPEMETN